MLYSSLHAVMLGSKESHLCLPEIHTPERRSFYRSSIASARYSRGYMPGITGSVWTSGYYSLQIIRSRCATPAAYFTQVSNFHPRGRQLPPVM